jgi:antitoxin (DNA-binding transcriptional repressor) of toxin-antitoxin stability system
MKTMTSVVAQTNFWQLMDTIPREPIIITKHGRNHAIVFAYDPPVTFGNVSYDDLSDETRMRYDQAKKIPKGEFINF